MINSFSDIPELKTQEPLSNYSTFKIGGPADYFIDCKDINQIPTLITAAKNQNLPVLIIGGGSNTIFHEKGFRGLVIKLSAFNLEITPESSAPQVKSDAGIILNALIMQTLKHGLVGMENLFGIPGTLGGAIRGNAGAHGIEIQDLLHSVTYFDPSQNKIITDKKTSLDFFYRGSTFKQWQQQNQPRIILQAELNLTHDPAAAQKASKEIFTIQKKRNAKYPSEPNCGSFFKNISSSAASTLITNHPGIPLSSGNIPVGWLSEQSGCKGLKVGDAQVSEKHGNFFINLGNATQTEVLALAGLVESKVHDRFGVHLEREVQFINENGDLIN